jgi:hypothetical protein
LAVVVLCSAKGAPGVTTSAMLLAALWPRPVVLVDADTAGGDVALRVPGPDGRPLNPDRGLLTLLPIARRGIAPQALREHLQELSGGTQVIAGLGSSEQAQAVSSLWPVLGETLARAEYDVIVDAGRVGPHSVHLPVLQQADLVVTVLRPGLTAVIHAREQVRGLTRVLTPPPRGPAHGLLILHPVKRDTLIAETRASVASANPGLLDLGQLAWDPQAALLFEGRPVPRPERTMLVRSGGEVVSAVQRVLQSIAAHRPAQRTPLEQPAVQPSVQPSVTASDATPPAGLRRRARRERSAEDQRPGADRPRTERAS